MQIIAQAAEQAKSVDPKKVAEAMKSGKTFKTVIGDIAFDKKGDITRPDYTMYVWKKAATTRSPTSRTVSLPLGRPGKGASGRPFSLRRPSALDSGPIRFAFQTIVRFDKRTCGDIQSQQFIAVHRTMTEVPVSDILSRLLAERGVLLADGATGTNYFDMGLASGEPPEAWLLEHPDKVADLHRRFVEAGSDIVLTRSTC